MVPLALLAGLTLASCGTERKAESPAADAPQGSTGSTVTIIATDFAFEAPSEVPAGLTTFRLVNRGPSIHHVQLVRLEEGKTLDDFFAALQAGGPPPKWMVMAGGPNPPELGDTSSVTMPLQAGNYAVVCFVPTPEGVPHLAKGMVRPLTVTAAAGPSAPEPRADLVMKLKDYDFELSAPLPAGRHTIRVENDGPQEHEVAIVRLAQGKTPEDFARWGERQVGPAPGTLHGGVSGIMPGAYAFVDVDLPAGEYGLICFVPDSKDGKGHHHHGMLKRITVS